MIPIKQRLTIVHNIGLKESINIITCIIDVCTCALNIVQITGIILVTSILPPTYNSGIKITFIGNRVFRT